VLLIGLLAAVSALGEEGAPLRLFEDFESQPLELVRTSIQEEVDVIMSPIGWTFAWKPLSGAAGDVSITLAVVRFNGTCSGQNLSNLPPLRFVLGETHTDAGSILPFADINCDAIRTLLAPGLFKLDQRQRDAVFGRAVGRVVAHELYHIFGNTSRHAARGVGEATYSARELLADEFRFQRYEVQILRAKLIPVMLQVDDWLHESTAPRGYSVFVKSGCNGCHGLHGESTRWAHELQDAGQVYTSARLSTLLKSGSSEMYRRAAGLNVMWPRLGAGDIEDLAWFLQNLFRGRASRGNSQHVSGGGS